MVYITTLFIHSDIVVNIASMFFYPYRGVYLASVVCCEDRILVTNDDLLPVIEVDENYTNASLNTDFHWLMKVQKFLKHIHKMCHVFISSVL